MTIMADKLRNLAKKPGAEKLAKSIEKADDRKAQAKKNPYKGKPKTQKHDSQLHTGKTDTRRAVAVQENKQNQKGKPAKVVPVTIKKKKVIVKPVDTLTEAGTAKLNKLIDGKVADRNQAKKQIRGAKSSVVAIDEKGLFPEGKEPKIGNGLAIKEASFAKGHIAGATGKPILIASAPRGTKPGETPKFYYLDEAGFFENGTIGDVIQNRK